MTGLRKAIAWLSSYCTVDGKQKIPCSSFDYKTVSHSPESTQVFTYQGLKMNSQNISFRLSGESNVHQVHISSVAA